MCPNCSAPLIILELRGVETDYCPACRGLWLDAGEVELLAELTGAPRGRLHAALKAAGEGRAGRRRCPRCGRRLAVVHVRGGAETAVRTEAPRADGPRAIELDKCPAGHGLWLDVGELGALVREFCGAADAAVAEFFGDLCATGLSDRLDDRPADANAQPERENPSEDRT